MCDSDLADLVFRLNVEGASTLFCKCIFAHYNQIVISLNINISHKQHLFNINMYQILYTQISFGAKLQTRKHTNN